MKAKYKLPTPLSGLLCLGSVDAALDSFVVPLFGRPPIEFAWVPPSSLFRLAAPNATHNSSWPGTLALPLQFPPPLPLRPITTT